MGAQFQTYQDAAGEFRWRFVASNGKIIAVSSESYVAKRDCEHGIELVKRDGPGAAVTEGRGTRLPA